MKTEEQCPSIGEIIKGIRLERRMTQVQLAKFLDVSEASVRNWEQGVSKPNRTCRQILKDKLGIDYLPAVQRKNNFYHLKARLKQMPEEQVLKIFESRQLENLVDGLKWAILTGRTKDEMMYIGLITMGLMQHCFKNGFEFEACLSMAINQVNKE